MPTGGAVFRAESRGGTAASTMPDRRVRPASPQLGLTGPETRVLDGGDEVFRAR